MIMIKIMIMVIMTVISGPGTRAIITGITTWVQGTSNNQYNTR